MRSTSADPSREAVAGIRSEVEERRVVGRARPSDWATLLINCSRDVVALVVHQGEGDRSLSSEDNSGIRFCRGRCREGGRNAPGRRMLVNEHLLPLSYLPHLSYLLHLRAFHAVGSLLRRLLTLTRHTSVHDEAHIYSFSRCISIVIVA